MDGGDAGVAERHAAVQGAERHVVACLQVVTLEHGGADAARDQFDPLERVEVGERCRVHRGVRLDVVDEGVDAAGRRHPWRAADGELGVDEGDLRDQVRAADALLYLDISI